jgi:hypothetical protein
MKELSARPRISAFVLVLVGSVALAACSSSGGSRCDPGGCTSGAAGTSGGGAGGATAGTSGGAGTTGGAGTSGAAGTSGGAGTSGAAGTSGGAGTSGAAGATTDAGAGGSSACPSPASLGAATVVMQNQSATEGGDRSTVTLHDSVSYLGALDSATRPNEMDVQLYKNAAPFGATLASMSISLVGQNNFATCGACVILHPLYNDGAPLHAQTNYIAKSGTLNVTAVPNGGAMQLTASLSNVTFEHVMIDSSFVTTHLDDCTITLTSLSIDDSMVKLITP